MSEKKPGFFKRLLGNLLGTKAEEAPAPEPEAKAVAPTPKPEPSREPAKAKVKLKARPKAGKKPPAAPKAKTPAKSKAPKPKPDTKAKAKPEPARPEPKAQVETPAAMAQPKPPATAPVAKPAPAKAETAPPPPKLPEPVAAEPPAESAQKKGWFSRLRDGLSKTSSALTDNITGIFTKRKLDAATLQELEDALIQADLGVDMAARIAAEVSRGRFDKEIAPEEVRAILGAEVAGVLEPVAQPLTLDPANRPHVILVVGVNGTGKTTTIGKLAKQFGESGKKPMLAAGDTFRAAAIDQLKIWGERTGAPVVASAVGADAAGLAYDALVRAREEKADVLLIDTAGRLHNKADLMAELAKVVRVLKKIDASAPHSVLLVLDATTGQNAIRQVEVFREIAGVTGLIMTKLDGTARGGILVAIAEKFALPVHAIGVGEGVDDLQPFDAYEFASLIAGAQDKVDA